MSATGLIIATLAIALTVTLAIGSVAINAERKKAEREKEKIRQEGAKNAERTADIITEASKIKSDANTGNHGDDMHTMADQLHQYANGGKQ